MAPAAKTEYLEYIIFYSKRYMRSNTILNLNTNTAILIFCKLQYPFPLNTTFIHPRVMF